MGQRTLMPEPFFSHNHHPSHPQTNLNSQSAVRLFQLPQNGCTPSNTPLITPPKMGDKNTGSVAEAQSAQLHSSRPQVAILDFGSQYSHLIARRVRELNVFCELYSCQVKADVLASNTVVGVILSGGPASVYDPASPHVDAGVWAFIKDKQLPVLGICYGMQEIAHVFGGTVSPSTEREFGRATVTKSTEHAAAADLLFRGVEQSQMWMSHGDKVTAMPTGFVKIASSENSDHAAIACPEQRLFGIQFHPEVTHSLHGKELLKNFVVGVCAAPTDWNMKDIADAFVREVQEKVNEGRAACAPCV